MRGLGHGQRIHVLVIDEVRSLVSEVQATSDYLADIIAWLITNSMRSELLQYKQLQLQTLSNTWRKAAFSSLLAQGNPDDFRGESAALFAKKQCAKVFIEPLLTEISDNVDTRCSFSKMLRDLKAKNIAFLSANSLVPEVDKFIAAATTQPASSDQGEEDEVDFNDREIVQEQEKEKDEEREMEVFQVIHPEGTLETPLLLQYFF